MDNPSTQTNDSVVDDNDNTTTGEGPSESNENRSNRTLDSRDNADNANNHGVTNNDPPNGIRMERDLESGLEGTTRRN